MGQWSNGAGQRRLRHVRLTRKDMGMKKIIVITGASSGFGALAARALARAGHIVYAGMRETAGRNAASRRPGRIYCRPVDTAAGSALLF